MGNKLFCVKLKKEAEALASPPFPGALGERIFKEISKEAWSLWLKQQTILINEHRFKMNDPTARAFLMQEMEKFLFEKELNK